MSGRATALRYALVSSFLKFFRKTLFARIPDPLRAKPLGLARYSTYALGSRAPLPGAESEGYGPFGWVTLVGIPYISNPFFPDLNLL